MNNDTRRFRLLRPGDSTLDEAMPEHARSLILGSLLSDRNRALALLQDLPPSAQTRELRRLRCELVLESANIRTDPERRSYLLHQLSYCHDPLALASLIDDFNTQQTSSPGQFDLLFLDGGPLGLRWQRCTLPGLCRMVFVNFNTEAISFAARSLLPRARHMVFVHHSPIASSVQLQSTLRIFFQEVAKFSGPSELSRTVKAHWACDTKLEAFLEIPTVQKLFTITSDLSEVSSADLICRASGPLNALLPLVEFQDHVIHIDLMGAPSTHDESMPLVLPETMTHLVPCNVSEPLC